MKAVGFWAGISVLGLFFLAWMVGFFLEHGWTGVTVMAIFFGAAYLVVRCSE